MLLSHNVAAFVVRYRHAPRYHYPIPVEDAQRALRMVRSKARSINWIEEDRRHWILGRRASAASVARCMPTAPRRKLSAGGCD